MTGSVGGNAPALDRLLRGRNDEIIGNGKNGQIAASRPAGDANTEQVKEQHRQAVVTFANLIHKVHGGGAGSAAWEKLELHLVHGQPLTVREAKIVVSKSVTQAVNQAAFEKLALRHVAPAFHDEARKILDEEMLQNADRDTRVLKRADLELMVNAVKKELDALQATERPLPNRQAVEAWAGTPKEDKFFRSMSTGYKEILTILDACNVGAEAVRQEEQQGRHATQYKDYLHDRLSELEQSLQKYCSHSGHTRIPEMQALLVQVTKEKQRLKAQIDQVPVTVGSSGAKIIPRRPEALDLDICKQSEPVKLGSGAFNTVELVTYQPPGQQNICEGVFKPNGTDTFPEVAGVIGIDKSNPGWPERNVASFVVNQAARLRVIPTTSFAVLKGKDGVLMDRAKGYSPFTTGTVNVPLTVAQMEFLSKYPETSNNLALAQGFQSATPVGNTLKFNPGPKGESIVALDFKDKVLRRELTNLNWLDILTGQIDRHAHNYFVERDANGNVIGVKGIDNDFCFGRHPPYMRIHDTDMPGVIDTETYQALMDLTADGPKGLRAQLNGLLNDAEIEATSQRLTKIQTTLPSYLAEGRVLEGDEWGTDKAEQLLGIPGDMAGMTAVERNQAYLKAKRASYVARQAGLQGRRYAPVLDVDQIQTQLKQLA